MAKLHELLAVNSNLAGQAEKARTDLKNTFEKKKHHFKETRKTFKSNVPTVEPRVEDQLDLQTTVPRELKWLAPFLVKAIDTGHQINLANTEAKADVVMEDGTTILKGVPTTSLLELTHRLNELHDFVNAIPTLDPALGFRPDPDRGSDVFKAREVTKVKTAKTNKALVLYPATDKHPAQTQLLVEDVPTGEILEQEWSGLVTVTDKGLMLERVEDLLRAVKKARARANDLEINVANGKIGKTLIDYVFGV